MLVNDGQSWLMTVNGGEGRLIFVRSIWLAGKSPWLVGIPWVNLPVGKIGAKPRNTGTKLTADQQWDKYGTYILALCFQRRCLEWMHLIYLQWQELFPANCTHSLFGVSALCTIVWRYALLKLSSWCKKPQTNLLIWAVDTFFDRAERVGFTSFFGVYFFPPAKIQCVIWSVYVCVVFNGRAAFAKATPSNNQPMLPFAPQGYCLPQWSSPIYDHPRGTRVATLIVENGWSSEQNESYIVMMIDSV